MTGSRGGLALLALAAIIGYAWWSGSAAWLVDAVTGKVRA